MEMVTDKKLSFFKKMSASPFHKAGTFWFLQPNANKQRNEEEQKQMGTEIFFQHQVSNCLRSLWCSSLGGDGSLPHLNSSGRAGREVKLINTSAAQTVRVNNEYAMAACELNALFQYIKCSISRQSEHIFHKYICVSVQKFSEIHFIKWWQPPFIFVLRV